MSGAMHSAINVLPHPPTIDDRLTPRRINSVNIALTNDCNLRCTYCPIGTGKYDKSYVSSETAEKIVDFIDKSKINSVGLGYSGEFTKVPEWHVLVDRLVNRDVSVSALSNFSKLFSPREIDAFSKMRAIQISVDTADAQLQKQIRRGMNLRTVIYNIGAIMAYAEKMGRAVPRFKWVCTITDKVVEKFESYVALAISLGINQVIVHQFLPFLGLQANCKDVLELSGPELRRAYDCVLSGIELGKRHGVEVLCQWLDLITQKVNQGQRDTNEGQSGVVSFRSILGEVEGFHSSEGVLSEIETVRCTLPWDTVYVGGEGNVYPCGVSPFPLGNIAEVSALDELLFNSKFQQWRKGLLTNRPQLPCKVCPVAGRCSIDEKERIIDRLPAFVG